VSYFFAFYGFLAEGIATGIQPIISYHQGSGQHHRVIATIKMALIAALGSGIVIIIIANLMPYSIAHIFNNDDQALIEETVNGLRLHLILMFLDGLIFICGVYFQAIHKTKIAMWINGGNIAVQIPALILMPLIWGLDGIWLALPVSNLIIAIPVTWLLWRDLQQRQALL
jgi:Na+-driven multidrug efflux pump